ncbi:MAG: hydroxyacid dehydrogenase [Bacteriovoracaceae bacterium]
MKPLIVVPDGLDKELFNGLKLDQNFEVYPESKVSRDQLKSMASKVNGLIIRSATTVDQELIDLMPNLKLVIRAGEGTDNIDKKYAATKGVKVANTPGANNNSAAEHAIALMFSVLRKTAQADASMKRGEWDKNSFTGNELSGKTLGVVGFGRIGQIVAKRLTGFDLNVLFFDPMIDKAEVNGAKKAATLEELFQKSDVITVHVPLMDQTKNMINAKMLSLMKPNAIIVNAARGKIVDEEALFDVLSQKKILGAGFDVFAEEPLKSSKLTTLSNIVLTPHLGASTVEAQERVGIMAVHQLKEFFVNNNMMNEVKA